MAPLTDATVHSPTSRSRNPSPFDRECKSRINWSRQPSSGWIVGLGGNDLGDGIIYIARVTGTAGSEYYRDRAFVRRPDCIYHFRGGELIRKKAAAYHEDPGNRARDIGPAPEYRNARVLLSSDFRYFGKPKEPIPDDSQAFVDSTGRGHRVNHDPARRDALNTLIGNLWRKYSGRKKIGEQHSKPDASVRCSRDEGSQECGD